MKHECIPRLTAIGISYQDALTLRRIAMTLHRWHELECGDSNEYVSWTITRGHKTGGVFEYDENGKPFVERHVHTENKPRYTPIADREKGAIKRLDAIMARYAETLNLGAYIQTDPRGASLYIIRPGDIPEGKEVEAYYSRGIAVYR